MYFNSNFPVEIVDLASFDYIEKASKQANDCILLTIQRGQKVILIYVFDYYIFSIFSETNANYLFLMLGFSSIIPL